MARDYVAAIIRETVAAHLATGASLRGVLVAAHRDCVVLAHASLLQSDGEAVPLDGEQLIPRGQLLWLQRLSETAP